MKSVINSANVRIMKRNEMKHVFRTFNLFKAHTNRPTQQNLILH